MKRAMNTNSTETQDDNNNNWFIDTGVGDICDELISKKNNNVLENTNTIAETIKTNIDNEIDYEVFDLDFLNN